MSKMWPALPATALDAPQPTSPAASRVSLLADLTSLKRSPFRSDRFTGATA